MIPNENIIPITFMTGTGGHFLCHMIISARKNNKSILNLSTYGNAHEGSFKDLNGPPLGPLDSDLEKINYFLSKVDHVKTVVNINPAYTIAHIVNINLINTHFKKSIRIIYEDNDIENLIKCIYGKIDIDMRNDPDTLKKSDFEKLLKRHSPLFNEVENMPNVLFISWKELFKGNIDDLVNKLSIFTDIDVGNFSKESLIHWRNKTQYCIDTFTEIS